MRHPVEARPEWALSSSPPTTKAQRQLEREDEKLLAQAAKGASVNARELTGGGFRRFLELRFGLAPTWAPTRGGR